MRPQGTYTSLPMLADLQQLETTGLAELQSAADAGAIEAWRIAYLGSNGKLKGMMTGLKDVPKEQKPAVGQRLNAVKAALEQAFEARKATVGEGAGAAGAGQPRLDLTEPGIIDTKNLGRRHIIMR